MDEAQHTTSVPSTAYATYNGYPITRLEYYRKRLWLWPIDFVVRHKFLYKAFSKLLFTWARLTGNHAAPARFDLLRPGKFFVLKRSCGYKIVYTEKVSISGNKSFAPLFLMRGIRNKPLWDKEEFPWIKPLLEDNYSRILQEARALQLPLRKTFGMQAWGTHVLFAGNIENTAVTQQCPFTAGLLKKVPRFCGNHSCFSFVRPHGFITRHTGEYNWIVRIQLALEIPDEGCYLEVAGEKIKWTEGKAIVFDDSYIHMAANSSDQIRSVLFFDVFHPDLSDEDIVTLSKFHEDRHHFRFLTVMSS